MIDSQTQEREGAPAEGTDKTKRVVYTIVDRPNGMKSHWVKIGVAKINTDNSMNIYLDALPLNGKLQLREEKEGAYRPSWQKNDSSGGAS